MIATVMASDGNRMKRSQGEWEWWKGRSYSVFSRQQQISVTQKKIKIQKIL